MTSNDPQILDRGVLGMSDKAWERLRQQDEVIAPLAAMATVTHGAADSAAEELGLSRRQVYTLIGRRRKGTGLLTDLAPGRSAGGRGGSRLPEPVEAVILEVIRKTYLTKQKSSLAVVHRQLCASARRRG